MVAEVTLDAGVYVVTTSVRDHIVAGTQGKAARERDAFASHPVGAMV